MIPPFSTSCANHTGHAGGWMLEWDGAKFVKASDLLQADRAAIDPLVAAEGEGIRRRQPALAGQQRVQDVSVLPPP
jgi:hypothetical protein